MNRIFNVLRLALFLLPAGMVAPSAVWAQYSEAVFDLKKAQDLYDERGFAQGAAISVDGKLAVNNQNGGVSYVYPISSFTSGGQQVDVSLNYCGAVQFTSFKKYDRADRQIGTAYSGWSRFHQNRPAWILGVAGWAVNMLSVTPHFHGQPGSRLYDDQFENYSDADLVWLADGYDFNNRMRDFGAEAQTEPYRDVISILRADGSVAEFVNLYTKTDVNNADPDTCAQLYTGYYFLNEANSRGYARVEYDSSQMFGPAWNYIADNVPSHRRYPVLPRILRFFPGDGTQVIFREYLAPYGSGALRDVPTYSGEIWGHPTIFYIEEIRSNSGTVVQFNRARHLLASEGAFNENTTRGRALITSFTGHEIRPGSRSMVIEALGRATKIKFDTISYSGTAIPGEKMPYAGLGGATDDALIVADYAENDSRLYRSYLGYVTEILDPEDRSTRFGYESYKKDYTNFGFPHSSGTVKVSLKNYRLTSVIEPSTRYNIGYYGHRDTLVNVGETRPKMLNNVVDSVRKYDRAGMLLTTDFYHFPDDVSSNGTTESQQWTTDHVTGHTKKTWFYYDSYGVNSFVPILTPSRHTVLATTIEQAGDVETITTTGYARAATMPAWGGHSNFTILPVSTVTTINGITRSRQEFSYELDTVRTFWRTPELASKYGMEVTRKITKTIKPDDLAKVLLVDTTTYLHLPMVDTTLTWTKVKWNKLKSIASFLYLRDTLQHENVVGKRWEELMFQPPVAVFDVDTLTERTFVPPIYGLEERAWTTDTTGAVTGKRNIYQTDIVDNEELLPRGALLSDSILGSNYHRILKGEYTYRNEVTGPLLAFTRNALGMETSYQYGPVRCLDVPYWEECDSTPPVFGTIVANDSTTREHQFQWSPFSYWFGKPALEQRIVRRYNADGAMHRDTLRTYSERTYHGQTSGIVDPNGWYSKFNYDYNGRLDIGWMPYDFPGEGVLDTVTYEGPERVDLYGTTHHHRRSDTVHCEQGWDGTNAYIISNTWQGPVLYTVNHDTLYASLPVTRVPECPPLPPSPAPAPKAKKGDDRQLQQFYERWLGYNVYTGYKGFFGVLSHQLDSASPIKNSLRLDSLNFEVMITSIDPECVHLEVAIDSIFTKTFVYNCSGPEDPPNGTGRAKNGGTRSLQGGGITPVAGGYLLKVDLDSVASQLRSRPYGSLMNIELRVKTPGATVAFVNGTNAEDLRPRLNVYGEYRKISDRADYTIAYQHDDANLKTTVSAKIDDARHTMNDLASQGIGARRSSITNFFGADYRMLKTERTVVEADTTGMLMTRIDTARQVHTGLGAKRLVADTEADSIVTNYDALNRPTEIINSDGTRSTIVYMQVRPDSLGLTDQEFYGYVDVKIVTNEIGVKNAQFSDAFGRLRREVADYGQGLSHHNLTTKYEYDLLGRLVEVINPKGQSTTYTHDEFGRVKTKTHPDLGTISYAYDDLGNIRFAQDQQQADKGLLTYNQYDDLNRLVLIGEAYIDQTGICGRYDEDHPDLGGCNSGSRLTDGLNGNKLHVASYQDDVTANPTLYRNPFEDVPEFPALASYRLRNCLLDPEPRLDETEAPVGPFIMHPTKMYMSKNGGVLGAGLDEFEDLESYPETGRIGISYDRMPNSSGVLWKNFPLVNIWDRLTPTGKVRNQKGNEAAVAYRDKASEPFHYSVMSYDERGRVEALLRYNENLGFDAVYYQYNSANQVIALTVADPLRRFTTWYGYDHQGRVDTVWTKLDTAWSGLLSSSVFDNLRFPGFSSRQGVAPEIVYSYNKTDRVREMTYPAIDVLVRYAYDHRKFLDSLVATRNGTAIFSQRMTYDSSGQMIEQGYQHGMGMAKSQSYAYDELQRLVSWDFNGETTQYQYDEVGSRTQVVRSNAPNEPYSYYSGTNRLWQREREDMSGNDTAHVYGYNANGAQTSYQVNYNTPWQSKIMRQEYFGYSFRGLMNRALTRKTLGNIPKPWQDWHYRYNAMGEREQKRMYKYQDGVVPAPDSAIYPWVYYLLGGNKQLAVYHGQELDSIQTDCGDGGKNRVYLYPHEYLTYGVGSSGLLVTRADGDREYKVVDHLGSTRVVLDENGTVIGRSDNTPFGESMEVVGTKSRKGFIDKETDTETSLANHGVRQYDAVTGRFISVDPLWEKYRPHTLYQYALNNPLRLLDCDGKKVEVWTETLGSTTLIGGGGILGVIAHAFFRPRHTYMRITTDEVDLLIELGGPKPGAKKGTLYIEPTNDAKWQHRSGQRQHEVKRPEGVEEGEFSFEEKILDDLSKLQENLPDYNAFGPNSNGFVRFLIENAGGEVELPNSAYYNENTGGFEKAYEEEVGRYSQEPVPATPGD